MSYRKVSFAPNEWYHCFSRTVDGRPVFEKTRDYERFLEALYLCNTENPIERGALYRPQHQEIFSITRAQPLVAVGAYCLMPNHFHLLLKEVQEGGIARFMQKVGTSFAMYFNISRKRVGNVFIKPFRSKHVADDRYLKQVFAYIHLNPAELFEPDWKTGSVNDLRKLEKNLKEYQHNSFLDYLGTERPQKAILDASESKFLHSDLSVQELLTEVSELYKENREEIPNL